MTTNLSSSGNEINKSLTKQQQQQQQQQIRGGNASRFIDGSNCLTTIQRTIEASSETNLSNILKLEEEEEERQHIVTKRQPDDTSSRKSLTTTSAQSLKEIRITSPILDGRVSGGFLSTAATTTPSSVTSPISQRRRRNNDAVLKLKLLRLLHELYLKNNNNRRNSSGGGVGGGGGPGGVTNNNTNNKSKQCVATTQQQQQQQQPPIESTVATSTPSYRIEYFNDIEQCCWQQQQLQQQQKDVVVVTDGIIKSKNSNIVVDGVGGGNDGNFDQNQTNNSQQNHVEKFNKNKNIIDKEQQRNQQQQPQQQQQQQHQGRHKNIYQEESICSTGNIINSTVRSRSGNRLNKNCGGDIVDGGSRIKQTDLTIPRRTSDHCILPTQKGLKRYIFFTSTLHTDTNQQTNQDDNLENTKKKLMSHSDDVTLACSTALEKRKERQKSIGELKIDNLRQQTLLNLDEMSGGWQKRRVSDIPSTNYNKQRTSIEDTMTVIKSSKSTDDDSKLWLLDKKENNGKLVKIIREPGTSYGISIVGGKVKTSENLRYRGIFIKDVIPNSPADKCGQLKVGDRILAVGDFDLRDTSYEHALDCIKNSGNTLHLLIQGFDLHDNDDFTPSINLNLDKVRPPPITPVRTPVPTPDLPELTVVQAKITNTTPIQKCNIITNNNGTVAGIKSPSSSIKCKNDVTTVKPVEKMEEATKVLNTIKKENDESDYSSDDDDEADNVQLSGRTASKAGVEIDRASAGNIKRTPDEAAGDKEPEDQFGYTHSKIKKCYGPLGPVFSYTIERKAGKTSLGLCIAGHRDRNKMACFVVGINPKGIAAGTDLKVGDEILEVNGNVLHGRCHLNVSAIIKSLPGATVRLIVLRRKTAIEDIAVKPVTQFQPQIEDTTDPFANYKNVRTITIQKGTSNLGIMIIEGKHSELGQGIFVSDIQDGSSAEKAGVQVGDMILAVNRENLLGFSYDMAASALRRTEGNVMLTISNPNKSGISTPSGGATTPQLNGGIMTTQHSSGGLDVKKPTSPSGKDKRAPQSPAPSAKEVDPLTCEIVSNQETTIEIKTENKPLGLYVVGGSNTQVNTGAVIIQTYPNSIADKDKRLKPYDQLLDVNGVRLTTDLPSDKIQRTIKVYLPKMRLTVFRADPPETTRFEVDLIKKSGKDLGIAFTERNGGGLIIAELLAGGTADIDGRIQKGDLLTHVNNEDLNNKNLDDCCMILKTCEPRVTLRLERPRPKCR